jgi:hypothetical protein
LNNQDLEYDNDDDSRGNNNYYDDYNNEDNDDEEIIVEEPNHSTTTTFLPQVLGLKNQMSSRPSSSDYSKDRDDDVTCQLPEIMQSLTLQIANVKASAASKNKLFINRLLRKEIKEEIRKVILH